jgi:hypothetical protein
MATSSTNPNPQNVYNYAINFTTTNLSNGNPFVEPHTVTLQNGSYNIPLNPINIQGNAYGPCIVVPLSTNINNGAPYLKFHLPQNDESVMYVTFCIRHTGMNDGYYDYVNGIPDAYRSALRTWIKDDRVTNINATTTLTKTLTFNVKGIDTNVVSATIPFTVTFSATFGGVLIEDDIAFTGPALG